MASSSSSHDNLQPRPCVLSNDLLTTHLITLFNLKYYGEEGLSLIIETTSNSQVEDSSFVPTSLISLEVLLQLLCDRGESIICLRLLVIIIGLVIDLEKNRTK